ncbi:MAG: hypothetical protein EXR86_04275 [Gammaproteobacteria bacterium]|nr:hypothetical protein [Gammaproteobacteria bacterium]
MPRQSPLRLRLILSAVLAIASGLAHAANKPKYAGWSDAPPPAGWSSDAYSPDHPPVFGEGLDASTLGPAGHYDAYFDPHHPLKNPNQDPGEKWGAESGRDGSPSVGSASADWNWGERHFDDKFTASIITNNCKSPQPVLITVNDIPYLTLPATLTVAPGQTKVDGNVSLPPEPPPPLRLGLPGEPGWGHVDFPSFIAPTFPPPKLHQPNFTPIVGSVVTWHPWAPTEECSPRRQTYTVSGHIHFRPPPPEGAGGPEKIASPSVCQVYWNIGVPPATYQGEDCTQEMRGFATAFRERVLPPYYTNAPEEWLWLPSSEDVQTFSVPQLLDLKAHASALMGGS